MKYCSEMCKPPIHKEGCIYNIHTFLLSILLLCYDEAQLNQDKMVN